MTATVDKVCACGEKMMDNSYGAYYCENCDYVQPQEAGDPPYARRKTRQDIQFEMHWLREFEKYKDNTKEVGNPNTEPEGGTTNE